MIVHRRWGVCMDFHSCALFSCRNVSFLTRKNNCSELGSILLRNSGEKRIGLPVAHTNPTINNLGDDLFFSEATEWLTANRIRPKLLCQKSISVSKYHRIDSFLCKSPIPKKGDILSLLPSLGGNFLWL